MSEFEKLLPKDRLGDAPVKDEYREQMVAIAHYLDAVFNGDARG